MTTIALGRLYEDTVGHFGEKEQPTRRDHHRLRTLLGVGMLAAGAAGTAYLAEDGLDKLNWSLALINKSIATNPNSPTTPSANNGTISGSALTTGGFLGGGNLGNGSSILGGDRGFG